MTTEALRRRISDGKLELGSTTTVIHDEAALASTYEQRFLLEAVRASGARLIEVGDGQQGQPVRAGGLWARLSNVAERAGSRVELTTIVRARDPADRRDQVLFRHGQHRQAVQGWADRDRITMTFRQADAEQRALAAWHADRGVGRETAIFYAGSNDRVDELNARAQAVRRLAGELGEDAIALERRPYELRAGDEVLVRARTWHPDLGRVENGTPARVSSSPTPGPRSCSATGARTTWTREQLDNADMRLGYVQHPWPGQGLTVDRLHYVHDELAGARSSYVAATRPREAFHIYAARETLEEIRDGHDELTDLDVLAQSLGETERDAPSIDLRRLKGADDRDLDVAPRPAMARTEPGEQTASERDDVHVSDPLDELRATLGPGLAARLLDAQPARGLRDASTEQLQAIVDEHQAAMDAFPATEALELRRLQRDREIATTQRDSAARDAATLQRRHDTLGRLRRDERARLRERIEARSRSADGAQREIDRASRREAELVAGERHPSTWVARHGDIAVQWAQARRELDIRRELELRDAVEQARTTPPPHIRDVLGEQPDRGPERHRYDALAADLEDWRLRHDVDVARDGVLGRPAAVRDRGREHFAERVRSSRQERGLPADPPGRTLEPELVEIDLELDI